jgi:hypothetical protein
MKTRTLVVIACFALLLGACHRRARVHAAIAQSYATGGAVVVAPAAPVSVSGRRYRNLLRVAGRDMQCDPRGLAAQEVSPGIFSLQGCGLVRDYVMLCRNRHRCDWYGIAPVEQVAMQETQCTQGQIQLALTGPTTRDVVACGQTLHYALACGYGGCAWSRNGGGAVMMQTDPGTSVIVVAEGAGGGAYASPQPQPAVVEGEDTGEIIDLGAAGTLQSLLATQIAAVRACTNGASVTLTVRWSAEGVVSVGLAPPLAGTPVEACVQRAIGTVQLQAPGAAGSIQASM